MKQILWGLFLAAMTSNAGACKLDPNPELPHNWSLKKLAEKSSWIAIGTIEDEIKFENQIRYKVKASKFLKGSAKDGTVETPLFDKAKATTEAPALTIGCHYEISLKKKKKYIFFSEGGNPLSVMNSNADHIDMVKQHLK